MCRMPIPHTMAVPSLRVALLLPPPPPLLLLHAHSFPTAAPIPQMHVLNVLHVLHAQELGA